MSAETPQLSIFKGPPIEEEPGLGALTLAGYIREIGTRFADNEALVLHEDGKAIRWTYAELLAKAEEVARALIARGIGKGERVGILMTNRPEFLSALFGTALAGGVATTISTFSTPAELDYLIQVSGVSALLLEEQVLVKNFTDIVCSLDPTIDASTPGALLSEKFPFLQHIAAVGRSEARGAVEGWESFVASGVNIAPEVVATRAETVTPADPGVLFFSSGSTSKPKGILSAHRGVALQLWRWKRYYGTKEDIRYWSANGFFWSGNFAMALGGTLSAGGSLILQKTFNPEEALELLEKEKATGAFAWPHQWAQLEGAPNFASVDLSSLKYVNPDNALGRHPTVDTDWNEPNGYGNTETFTLSADWTTEAQAEERAGAIGRVSYGCTIKIVDPLTSETVPLGERGEIAVKGKVLMLGYLGIPLDETLDEQGFLRTGDGGYFDATGRLYWEGRLNDIIKTGGANVSPLEIDAVIKDAPGVKATQTVGVPHDTLGEIVVTCIIPHEGATLDEEGIRAFAKQVLASYKVPRRVLFFAEGELEMTGSAKIKTKELRELAGKRLAE